MADDVKQCGGPSDPSCSLKQYVPVPVEGDYVVRSGKVLKVENMSVMVKGVGVPESLAFNVTGWVDFDHFTEVYK